MHMVSTERNWFKAWTQFKKDNPGWMRLPLIVVFMSGHRMTGARHESIDAFYAWRRSMYGKVSARHAFKAGFERGYDPYASLADSGAADVNLVASSSEEATSMQQVPFGLLREFVRSALIHPFQFKWTVQGFGMLRTYIGPDERFRLNIWSSKLAVPNVSIVHDHPWSFTSWVINGEFTNLRYQLGTLELQDKFVSACPPNFHRQRIETGENGGPIGEVDNVFLQPMHPEQYTTGGSYSQASSEIHASYYDNGTVTLNERRRVNADGPSVASVFYPIGYKWVDAKPRLASIEEIQATTALALEKWR